MNPKPDDDVPRVPRDPLDGYCIYSSDGTVHPVTKEQFLATFATQQTITLTVRGGVYGVAHGVTQ